MENLKKVIEGIQQENGDFSKFREEMMDNQGMRDMVSLMLDSMKNNTYSKLLGSDQSYRATNDEVEALQTVYDDMELDAGDKTKIDTLLSLTEEAEWSKRVNAYLAGIIDGYMLLKFFGVINE